MLIGPTAIELGGRYSTNRFGMVAGVVIQAIATETLIHGTNLKDLGKFPALLLVAILMFICAATRKLSSGSMIGIAFASIVALVPLLLLAEYLRLATFSNVPAFFFLLVFILSQKLLTTTTDLKTS